MPKVFTYKLLSIGKPHHISLYIFLFLLKSFLLNQSILNEEDIKFLRRHAKNFSMSENDVKNV